MRALSVCSGIAHLTLVASTCMFNFGERKYAISGLATVMPRAMSEFLCDNNNWGDDTVISNGRIRKQAERHDNVCE